MTSAQEASARAWTEYWVALGRFIHKFSQTENMVVVLLAVVAGLDVADQRALFSGTRVTDACNFVRRLFEAKGRELPKDLQRAFEQLAAINGTRNDIVYDDAGVWKD